MADVAAPVTPAAPPVTAFVPNPTLDTVQAQMMAHIATGEPQGALAPAPDTTPPAAAPAAAPVATPPAPAPAPAPSEIDRVRKQMARREQEWAASSQMAQRKYEAELQQTRAELAALKSMAEGRAQPATDPARPAPDPFQSEVTKYLREQAKQLADVQAQMRAQEEQAQAVTEIGEWKTRASSVLDSPEFGLIKQYCKARNTDPIAALAQYTHEQIQAKGVLLGEREAAEDLLDRYSQEVEAFKSVFASGPAVPQVTQAPQTQIKGLGGAPESGMQGKPVSQEENFASLVDSLDSKGFFRQG